MNTKDRAEVEVQNILSHFKTYGATKLPELSDPVSKFLMNRKWNYTNWAKTILESDIDCWSEEFREEYMDLHTYDG